MESSDDEPSFKYIQIIIVTLGIALWVMFLWQLSSEQTRGEIEEYYATRDYSKSAEDNIEKICLTLSFSQQAECIEKKIEAKREEQRSERDLEAQEMMARWTWVMGGVAGIGFGVSLIGIALIYKTFEETRRAANSATSTHNAYVAVESAKIVVSPQNYTMIDGRWCVILNVSNIGRSDCVISSYSTAWQADAKFETTKAYLGNVLIKHIKAGTTTLLGAIPLSSDYPTKHFLRGIVAYSSTLKERQITHFCYCVDENIGDDSISLVGTWVTNSKGGDWPQDT